MAKPTSTIVLTAHRLHGALRWASNTAYGNTSSVRKLVRAQETGCLAQKLVMCKALAQSLYLNSLWTNTYSGSWSTWRGTATSWATCSHTPAWEGSETITLCWLGKYISELQFKLRQRESALKHLKTSWGYKGWVEKGTDCDTRKNMGLTGRWLFSHTFLFSSSFWLGQLCHLSFCNLCSPQTSSTAVNPMFILIVSSRLVEASGA